VGSAIINYLALPELGSLSHETASGFLAFYWGGLMVGRFMGAFALSDMKKGRRHLLVVTVPVLAVAATWLISGREAAGHWGALLAVLLLAFLLGEASAHRMLALFSVVIIGLLLAGILGTGGFARWSVLGVGLFCSVMWSNIFSLAIEGLGPLKSQASSLLIMAILGAALLPPLQGLIADQAGIRFSFIVPIGAFAYVAFYGLYGYRAGKRTNSARIEYATASAAKMGDVVP
jgi:FHS family L-fucose permease-like MFS transporter